MFTGWSLIGAIIHHRTIFMNTRRPTAILAAQCLFLHYMWHVSHCHTCPSQRGWPTADQTHFRDWMSLVFWCVKKTLATLTITPHITRQLHAGTRNKTTKGEGRGSWVEGRGSSGEGVEGVEWVFEIYPKCSIPSIIATSHNEIKDMISTCD